MMAFLNRRGLLTLIVCGGAATVTAASWLRKPPEFPARTPIAHPVVQPTAESGIAFQGMDAMVATNPPRPLPAFTFQDADGHKRTMADYRGKPVVLNLWATWCQPCIAELPALAALARQPDSGITVVALSTDRGGAAAVRRFFAAHNIDLPILVDPDGASGQALGARGLPTTIILDAQGRERGRFEGAADWSGAAARETILALTRET
jgi:peroxiredoxin